jgi:nucleotide-binding universal stress UspA family protein
MQLLCGTDGSIAGAAALRISRELADRLQGELAMLGGDLSDPAPRLLRAGRASGCDRIVVGVARDRPGALGSLPEGWQRRFVRDAPCPLVLVPLGAALPSGGRVVLSSGMNELPSQAAGVAGRLATILRTPLIITHALPAGVFAPCPSARQLDYGVHVPADAARCGADAPLLAQRHPDRHAAAPIAELAAEHGATLVVIGGRGPGRTLLPRRRAGLRMDARRPIVVAAAPPRL